MRRKNSPTNSSPPETIELTIDSLSYHGGRGVGRYNGIVVFVGGVVPGDRVRVRTTHKKSRLWEAELLEVLEPSPHRRLPPCPVANRCGGCSWQQVTYDIQVQQKEKILRDALRGLNQFGEWQWLDFDRAPQEFNYRNRVQIHFREGRSGFFSKGTRDLVAIERCWIAEDKLNDQIKNLKAADGAKVEIAITESGEVRVMAGERDPEAALFSQVNTAQNEILKTRLIESIQIKPDWLMDLYAGAGNLSFPLAKHFPGVPLLAVELSRTSIARAKASSENHLIGNRIEWLAEDVGPALAQRGRLKGRGVVILDPPRTGLSSQVCSEVIRHHPQQIVYVSCNPTTFARDAGKLLTSGKYRLDHVRGIDMFPQTEHVELIARFTSTI